MGKKTLGWERLDLEVSRNIKGECPWIMWVHSTVGKLPLKRRREPFIINGLPSLKSDHIIG